MSDNIRIRPFRAGDEAGATALFRKVFGREMSIEEYRWKYTGFGVGVHAAIAEDEGHNILGHYGGVPLRMYYRDGEIRGASMGDVMIHPRFRGIKNLKALTHKVEDILLDDGFVVAYGFPNEKTLMSPAEKLGLFDRFEEVFEGSKSVAFHNTRNRFLYKLFPLSFEDERIDALWHHAKRHLALAIIRDRKYLQWRYRDHPLFSYELWGMRRRAGMSLFGLAVIKRPSPDKIMVMDIVLRKHSFTPLMEKIENLAAAAGAKTLHLWLPQGHLSLLRERRFEIHSAGTTIPFSTNPGFLRKGELRGKFFYTMGDTDFL